MTTRDIISEIKILRERIHELSKEYDRRVGDNYDDKEDE